MNMYWNNIKYHTNLMIDTYKKYKKQRGLRYNKYTLRKDEQEVIDFLLIFS